MSDNLTILILTAFLGLSGILIVWLLYDRIRLRRVRLQMDEKLSFETLVSSLSADFASLKADQVDASIDRWLQELCEFLDVDRGTLLYFATDSPLAFRSHSYAAPGIPAAPEVVGDEKSPWYAEQLRKGIVLNFPRMASELSEAARIERVYVERQGIKSHLTVPIVVDGSVVFALGLSTMRSYRVWPDEMVGRLRLVGEIFAQTLLRRQAEASLVNSQNRYAIATASGGVSVWDLNLETGEVYSDPVLPMICGLPQTTKLSRDEWLNWVHPDDLERVFAYEQQLIATEEVDWADVNQPVPAIEYRVLHAKGGHRWVQIRGSAFQRKDGKPYRLIGTMTEITERKAVEEALRESEARYRNVVETQTELICRFKRDTTLTFVNDAYCRYFEKSREELIGTKFIELISPQARASTLALIESLMADPKSVKNEHEVIAPGGRIGWQEWVNHAILDSDGRVIEFQAVGRDMTELRAAGEELRKAQAELQHVSRVMTMGEFLSSIAHEVNQPLAAIRTCGEAGLRFLSGDTVNLARSREALANIVSDSIRASEVIKRLRGLIKKTEPEKTLLDANDVIHEVISLTQHELESHDVEVFLNLENRLPAVSADRVQVQQVLLNLIANAIEAMNPMPTVERSLTISSKLEVPESILISVHDSGPGLKPEDSKKIFEAFFSTKPEGIGLGLSISRTIIESHGGRLWAASNGSGGAKIQFTLPVNTSRDGPDAPNTYDQNGR